MVIYLCFKTYFLIDYHCKTQLEFSDLLEKYRITELLAECIRILI